MVANDQMPKDALLLSQIGREFLDWIHVEYIAGFLGKHHRRTELFVINSSCSCPGGRHICLNSCYKCTLGAHGWGLVSLWVISKAAWETQASLSLTTSSLPSLMPTSGTSSTRLPNAAVELHK